MRRDQVLEDQDYVEVFLDPLNTRRSAFFFRVNARGIPLSSLRYQTGVENSWGYVVYRNPPRQQVTTIASAPIPRGENCDLCYANVLDGWRQTRSSPSH